MMIMRTFQQLHLPATNSRYHTVSITQYGAITISLGSVKLAVMSCSRNALPPALMAVVFKSPI
jgi:hypothetical protein